MYGPSMATPSVLTRRRALALMTLGGGRLLTGCSDLPEDSSTSSQLDPGLDSFPLFAARDAVPASASAIRSVKAMGRGINFGNMLDAPTEGGWGLTVEDRFINLVGPRDFVQSVRLPVRWSNHASTDSQAKIAPEFMARVDDVVRRLLGKGVTVVLNMHHYRQFDGDPLDTAETAVAPGVVDVRFMAMWKQIAEHFAGFDQRLVFELYNEPHGRLDTRWNDLLSRALRVVRESNPERTVVVGPVQWNSAHALSRLVLPADPNVALTVHHYEPFGFTHQGAEWVKPSPRLGVTCCSPTQRQQITDILDLAVRGAERLRRPMFVGEFGAYEKAALPDRVAYLQTIRAAMEERGLPWMYWELAAGFGVYDRKAGAFRPEIKAALYGA